MARPSLILESLPGPVSRAVAGTGENIRIARQRRRETQAALAARMMVSLPTLRKVERGDPSVSIAIYFTALWALGLIQEVRGLAAPEKDVSASLMELARLPKRVRHARK